MGTFRRGKLQGFGVRLGSEGRIEGNFSWGMIEGLAFTYVVKENFGLLANYNNDVVKEVLQKTHLSTQTEVSKKCSSRSPQIQLVKAGNSHKAYQFGSDRLWTVCSVRCH